MLRSLMGPSRQLSSDSTKENSSLKANAPAQRASAEGDLALCAPGTPHLPPETCPLRRQERSSQHATPALPSSEQSTGDSTSSHQEAALVRDILCPQAAGASPSAPTRDHPSHSDLEPLQSMSNTGSVTAPPSYTSEGDGTDEARGLAATAASEPAANEASVPSASPADGSASQDSHMPSKAALSSSPPELKEHATTQPQDPPGASHEEARSSGDSAAVSDAPLQASRGQREAPSTSTDSAKAAIQARSAR